MCVCVCVCVCRTLSWQSLAVAVCEVPPVLSAADSSAVSEVHAALSGLS